MAKFGGTLQMPTNKTIFGCLYFASMLISLLNSLSSYSSILGLKFFFTATWSPLYMPLWMVLNPPWEIWGPTSKLLKLISRIESVSSWKESLPLDRFSFTDILSNCLCNYYTLFCYVLNLLSIYTILPNVLVSFMAYLESSHEGAWMVKEKYLCLFLFARL